ncbi:MAG TPA: hypothetical protein VHQ43_08900 [Solirubrobacterales bacterium]|jgi:hypothetical protein|nr:hypothetical protein [Solirubrobacterales bacterium]
MDDSINEPPEEPTEDSADQPTDEPIDDFAHQKFMVSPSGRELFVAVFAIEVWLDSAPGGALSLVDDDEAQAILGSFIDGWRTHVTHAVAAGPLTLAELQRVVDEPEDLEELEALVAGMRGAGLLSARPDDGEGASYAVTDWLREAVGPMVVAMRSELRQATVIAEEEEVEPPDDPPFSPESVEAAFLLALPLLELPAELSGVCRLVVDLPYSDEGVAGATIHVEDGRVASCEISLDDDADAWIKGPTIAWMDAAVDGAWHKLELGGKRQLARAVVASINKRLFGGPPGDPPRS